MLQRIKSKKGFTLAELLIVVAIIAVLTAIAVPLFVTSLQRAEKTAFEANKDALRSAGIVALLSDPDFELSDLTGKEVLVTGTVGADGKMTDIKVKLQDANTGGASEYDRWKTSKGPISVVLTVTDLSEITIE